MGALLLTAIRNGPELQSHTTDRKENVQFDVSKFAIVFSPPVFSFVNRFQSDCLNGGAKQRERFPISLLISTHYGNNCVNVDLQCRK